MICMSDVFFSYGEKTVLKAFSLEAKEGERVCLFGPSGCGKTTVLQLLAGIRTPNAGTVIAPPATVVFQEDRLLPWLTVLENVALVLPKERMDEAAEWLDKVGLQEVKNAYPHKLSGGMRRRVAIARALAMGGSLLLLDEPFTGLDADTRELCAGLLKDRFRDAVILLVTHLPEEAAMFNAKVIPMKTEVAL